jgi:hypothetical protein
MEQTPNQGGATPGEAAAEALLDKMYPTMKPEAESQTAAKAEQQTTKPPDQGGEKKSSHEPGPGEKAAREEATPEKPVQDQGDRQPEFMETREYGEIQVPELPYGTVLDEKTLGEFAALASEAGLPKDEAQKMLDFGGAKIKAIVEAPYKEWRDTQTKWQAEVKADPEIGGKNYEQAIKDAGSIFKPSDSNPLIKTVAEAEALRKALTWTGAGNNPAMVKFFVRAARLMAKQGGGLSRMYDKM